MCTDNLIGDLNELENIRFFTRLVEASFLRNPCCKANYRYRDRVIAVAADSLRMLDEVPITAAKLDSIRAMQTHRRKVAHIRELKEQQSEVAAEDSLDAGRTFEDMNDFDPQRDSYNH